MEGLGGGVGAEVPLPCSRGGVGEAVGDEQSGRPAVGEGAQAGEELVFGAGVECAGPVDRVWALLERPVARRLVEAAARSELGRVVGFVGRTDASQVLADRLARRLAEQMRLAGPVLNLVDLEDCCCPGMRAVPTP
ncbi:hypothetical protein ACWDR0_30920 [Streptomyces sp. NPDC003691]